MVERLTKANVNVDPTAAKYMGDEVNVQDINDRLLDLVLNGPTLNAVGKDKLRQIIRQLYDALKPYEDLDLKPVTLSVIRDIVLGVDGDIARLRELAQADKEGLVVFVSEIKDYLQAKLDEWNALGERKFEPANMWGYNFIMACFDDLEARKKGAK